jgi:hypothetical protein
MKKTLAENMLRFGTKNLPQQAERTLIVKSIMDTINEHGLHNAIKRRLTESTLKQLDPAMANAQKYFAAEWVKGTNGPQFATANFIYEAQPARTTGNQLSYNINLKQAISVSFGVTSFIYPVFYGMIDYDNVNGLTDDNNLELQINLEGIKEPDLKTAAASINDSWSAIQAQVALTHLAARKAVLTQQIASIKASTTFAALGPLLTGTAKAVYNTIAA